jgi:hypothetical protein
MKLSAPLTVEEVAGMLRWDWRRTRNWLVKLDEETHGMLLRKEGTGRNIRYTTTLAALRRVAPDLFEPPDLREEVAALSVKVRDLESRINVVAEASGKKAKALTKDLDAMKRRLVAMSSAA